MVSIEDIDYAINETLKAHPEFMEQYPITLKQTIQRGVNLKNFTSKNGARNKMANAKEADFLEFIITEIIKIYNSSIIFANQEISENISDKEANKQLNTFFPYFNNCYRIICEMANTKNLFLLFKENDGILLDAINIVLNNRYKNENRKKYIDYYGKYPQVLPNEKNNDLFEKLKNNTTKNIKNLKINYNALNKCLNDVLSGSQLKNKRNEYALSGEMFVTQDIGKVRKNQEDSAIIMEHPYNKDFKLLAVADGMGGLASGEFASSYTLQKIIEWFNILPKEMYYDNQNITVSLNDKIRGISNDIYTKMHSTLDEITCGTTLVVAIVTQNETLISSVGDSRAYILKKGKLQLVTQDQSVIWPKKYTPESIPRKLLDDMRFSIFGNQILGCIGKKNIDSIDNYKIKNDSYDKLLLFTDGITDLVGFDRIQAISSRYDNDRITSLIVNEALNKNAVRKKGTDSFNYGEIKAGKDNATAVMYARR